MPKKSKKKSKTEPLFSNVEFPSMSNVGVGMAEAGKSMGEILKKMFPSRTAKAEMAKKEYETLKKRIEATQTELEYREKIRQLKQKEKELLKK